MEGGESRQADAVVDELADTGNGVGLGLLLGYGDVPELGDLVGDGPDAMHGEIAGEFALEYFDGVPDLAQGHDFTFQSYSGWGANFLIPLISTHSRSFLPFPVEVGAGGSWGRWKLGPASRRERVGGGGLIYIELMYSHGYATTHWRVWRECGCQCRG